MLVPERLVRRPCFIKIETSSGTLLVEEFLENLSLYECEKKLMTFRAKHPDLKMTVHMFANDDELWAYEVGASHLGATFTSK